MKELVVSAVILASTLTGASPAPERPVFQAAEGTPIDGSYIVQLRRDADPEAVTGALDVRPRYVYRKAVTGFAGDLTGEQLAAVRRHPDVVAVSQNVESEAADTVQPLPPWGLDRIDQRSLPLNYAYVYGNTGESVRVYVIDSGIDAGHDDFEGRAMFVHNSIDSVSADCTGHGTHVAGIIGGKTYGVAKKAKIRAVKMLNCANKTNTAAAIDAVEWVTANAIHPAVANASWGAAFDPVLETAIEGLISSGVYLATSAGNTGGNSCGRLPRKVSASLVVGNSTNADARNWSSSIGPCVDIYAPGTKIRSSLPGEDNDAWTGTSMAAPHAAGFAAVLKHGYGDLTATGVTNLILACATKDELNPASLTLTPNLLLHTCGL